MANGSDTPAILPDALTSSPEGQPGQDEEDAARLNELEGLLEPVRYEPPRRDTSGLVQAIRDRATRQAEALGSAREQALRDAERQRARALVNMVGGNIAKIGTPSIDPKVDEELALLREAERRAAEIDREAALQSAELLGGANVQAAQLQSETNFQNAQAQAEADFQQRQAERERQLQLFDAQNEMLQARDEAVAERNQAERRAVEKAVRDPRLIPFYTEQFGWDDERRQMIEEEAAKRGPEDPAPRQADEESPIRGLTPGMVEEDIRRLERYIKKGRPVTNTFTGGTMRDPATGEVIREPLSSNELIRAQEQVRELREIGARLREMDEFRNFDQQQRRQKQANEAMRDQVTALQMDVPEAPGAGVIDAVDPAIARAARERYSEVDRVTESDMRQARRAHQQGELTTAQLQYYAAVYALQQQNQ